MQVAGTYEEDAVALPSTMYFVLPVMYFFVCGGGKNGVREW